MKINDHLYVDIGLGTPPIKDNFLGATDLVDLQIIETSGACLPVVYALFRVYDEPTARYFIQNNVVVIRLGETEENADSFTVVIHDANPPVNDNAGGSWMVEFTGFVKNRTMMYNLENETYKGNSQMVVYQVLQDYLGVKPSKGYYSDILRTNENQVVWRRNNETASTFIAETLVHMDITPSFPLFCFDKHGDFYLRDFNKLIKEKPSVSFVAREPRETNEIQFVNNFSVDSYKDMYNLYSGYNKVTEIYKIKTGLSDFALSRNEPILASTKVSEKAEDTSRKKMNVIQSANVHSTYVSSFVHNTNKAVALSAMQGELQLVGKYYNNFRPTDIVNVETANLDKAVNGRYIIDTIRTQADMKHGGTLKTYVYVTRDNSNSLENFIIRPKKGLKIQKFWADVMNAISELKAAYAMALLVMDGTYMQRIMSFAVETKRNLLRAFNVAGVTVDFTTSANLLRSMVLVGNSLMNTLISMIFPSNIAEIFRDFIILKPTLKALLSNYLADYVPFEVRDVITALINALFKTTDSLNSMAKDNNIKVSVGESSSSLIVDNTSLIGDETMIDTTDSNNRVNEIINDFERNTTGLYIPFPIIELTEAQSLMPQETLRDYVATETINNLTNLGYLNGVDKDKLKDILLGETPIDFDIVNQINSNAGNSYNYRFWGTFGSGGKAYYAWKGANDELIYTTSTYLMRNSQLYNADGSVYKGTKFKIDLNEGVYAVFFENTLASRDKSQDVIDNNLTELTSFYIKKGYKDKYRTLPCTKFINAVDNSQIFFACPSTEMDVKFYINSKREELPSFETYLGYTDIYDKPIKYTVYYTERGYNSNSVLFEVKQGGMV